MEESSSEEEVGDWEGSESDSEESNGNIDDLEWPTHWMMCTEPVVDQGNVGEILVSRWKVVMTSARRRLRSAISHSRKLKDYETEHGQVGLAWGCFLEYFLFDLRRRLIEGVQGRRIMMLAEGEEYLLLAGIMACAFYGQSPSVIRSLEHSEMFSTEVKEVVNSRFMELLAALDSSEDVPSVPPSSRGRGTPQRGGISRGQGGRYETFSLFNFSISISIHYPYLSTRWYISISISISFSFSLPIRIFFYLLPILLHLYLYVHLRI